MASYTEKLKLLKKDPILDGDDTFNIETMLNENWDKIDEKVGELDDKSTNIKAEDIKLSDGKTVEAGITEALNKADQAFQSASDGKTKIATAITGKGVPTSSSDTFQKMATNIDAITTDPSIGTTNAIAADLLAGKKAISQGELVTGTMPTFQKDGSGVVIGQPVGVNTYEGFVDTWVGDAGYIPANSYFRNLIPDLSPSNTRAGVKIGAAPGFIGTFTADATIPDSSWLLTGASAYKNGEKLIGTMPKNDAMNSIIANQGGQINIPYGYHGQGGKVTANFLNLTPPNIKAGVNVGGVVGTYEPVAGIVMADTITASKNRKATVLFSFTVLLSTDTGRWEMKIFETVDGVSTEIDNNSGGNPNIRDQLYAKTAKLERTLIGGKTYTYSASYSGVLNKKNEVSIIY